MKITKRKSEIGTYDIRIEENEDKHLDVLFGGNGDIYWIYDNYEVADVEEDSMYEAFEIPSTEPGIYKIFNELYEDLVNCRIFVPEINELYPGQIKEDEERCRRSNEDLKKDYRYNLLVKDKVATNSFLSSLSIILFLVDVPFLTFNLDAVTFLIEESTFLI